MIQKYFDINEGGFSVRCKLYCSDIKNIERAVIFTHGFAGHKDNKAAEKFAGKLIGKYKDFCVVAFNWPCHGDDARNKLRLSECDAYLTLVIEYVKKQFDTGELYAYATSFGAYLVLKYISEHGNPFRKAALRCPAITIYDSMLERIIPENEYDKLMKGKTVQVGFDRKIKIDREFLEELKAADVRKIDFTDYAEDLMIVHGTKDEMIPFETSFEFADQNIIEFVPMQNGDHRFTDPKIMDLAIHTIIEFITG